MVSCSDDYRCHYSRSSRFLVLLYLNGGLNVCAFGNVASCLCQVGVHVLPSFLRREYGHVEKYVVAYVVAARAVYGGGRVQGVSGQIDDYRRVVLIRLPLLPSVDD